VRRVRCFLGGEPSGHERCTDHGIVRLRVQHKVRFAWLIGARLRHCGRLSPADDDMARYAAHALHRVRHSRSPVPAVQRVHECGCGLLQQ
jgi:hypothetical protein